MKVVGVFEDGGSSFESEVWADLDTVRAAFGREGCVSSACACGSRRRRSSTPSRPRSSRTSSSAPGAARDDVLREAVRGDEPLHQALGTLIAFFFSVGAMIGAMITMYAAVANRQREIGTLRALGFSRASILVVVPARVGRCSRSSAGRSARRRRSLMGFVQFSMMNFASWSEIVFAFEPTPRILVARWSSARRHGDLRRLLAGRARGARSSPVEAMRG